MRTLPQTELVSLGIEPAADDLVEHLQEDDVSLLVDVRRRRSLRSTLRLAWTLGRARISYGRRWFTLPGLVNRLSLMAHPSPGTDESEFPEGGVVTTRCYEEDQLHRSFDDDDLADEYQRRALLNS